MKMLQKIFESATRFIGEEIPDFRAALEEVAKLAATNVVDVETIGASEDDDNVAGGAVTVWAELAVFDSVEVEDVVGDIAFAEGFGGASGSGHHE